MPARRRIRQTYPVEKKTSDGTGIAALIRESSQLCNVCGGILVTQDGGRLGGAGAPRRRRGVIGRLHFWKERVGIALAATGGRTDRPKPGFNQCEQGTW